MIDWTQIIIYVIGIVITGILIPLASKGISLLKSKLGQTKSEVLDDWISKFCVVAETVFTESGTGEQKKEWVIQKLIDNKLIKEENREVVGDIITAICKELTVENLINDK